MTGQPLTIKTSELVHNFKSEQVRIDIGRLVRWKILNVGEFDIEPLDAVPYPEVYNVGTGNGGRGNKGQGTGTRVDDVRSSWVVVPSRSGVFWVFCLNKVLYLSLRISPLQPERPRHAILLTVQTASLHCARGTHVGKLIICPDKIEK